MSKLVLVLGAAGLDYRDGEGAVGVTRTTVDMARAVMNMLPAGMDDPEIAATPHGEIDLDWFAGRASMFTLCM